MTTSRRPNVLWIFCDELRTDALGCYGNDYATIRTPNIDRIAASGLRFEQCFVTSPVCVSSRTSMLTGLYPEQTGVYHNEGSWPNFVLDELPVTFPERCSPPAAIAPPTSARCTCRVNSTRGCSVTPPARR